LTVAAANHQNIPQIYEMLCSQICEHIARAWARDAKAGISRIEAALAREHDGRTGLEKSKSTKKLASEVAKQIAHHSPLIKKYFFDFFTLFNFFDPFEIFRALTPTP
jgi:hypothetical protein